LPLLSPALEGVSDGVFYAGNMEHYHEVDKGMIEEEYEKPDVTKIVHALIIYALVVLVGGFLLIGLSNQEQKATAIVRCK
jgi:hypothetical protein